MNPTVTGSFPVDLEEGSFVYRALDCDGRVLYVGLTNDLPTRLARHRHTSAWYAMTATVEWEWHTSRLSAQRAEALQIRRHDPPNNVIGRRRWSVTLKPTNEHEMGCRIGVLERARARLDERERALDDSVPEETGRVGCGGS